MDGEAGRWATSGNIGLPPLARVTGVGRQQQQHNIIKEQAGFRAGKSCTSQLLNLTQYIEDGYEKSLTTGTVYVDLSAAYDTVSHRVLLTKLYGMTEDAEFTKLIGSMMRNRRFYVELN